MNEIDRQVELAQMFTPLLRTSTNEQWPAVREFLKDRGVDPDRAAVGDVFPDQGLFIIVAAEDGRAFELTTWFEPDDETNYVIESWHELAGDGRDIHSGALYGAFALLSEETEGVADPVEILVETVERSTRELRHEDDWTPLRQAMLEAGVDPRRAILVDWVHSLAVDAPPERSGMLYVDGRWFAFTAGEDSPVGRMEQVWTWRASDEPEARDRHGPLVDAALRAASKEALGGES